MNGLVYGFLSQAGLGLALWLLARLGRVALRGRIAVTLSTLFWNLGVALGVVGILSGESTGYEWLEMPRLAMPLLFFSYVVIGVWALITFHARREPVVYVSQWYVLAALFSFPWIYSAAGLLLVWHPVRGTVQAMVNGWFGVNLFNLWLTPLGLATAFYFIPRLLGRPLHSRYLAIFGFWTLVLFGGWGGLGVGAPLPRWSSSVGVVAAVLLVVPLIAVALNWFKTLAGARAQAMSHPILRFVVFGAVCYVVAGLLGAVGTFRSVSPTTRFTLFAIGINQLQLFGFLTMVFTAGIYHIIPRVTRCEWPSSRLVGLHYWTAAAGVVLTVVPLVIGGVIHGRGLNDPNVPFVDAVRSVLPFIGLGTLGILLLLVASLALVLNLARLMAIWVPTCCRTSACGVQTVTKPAAAGANL